MIWLLGGYMWLFVHRPFEYYPALGDAQLERVYMIGMLLCWIVSPEKGWTPNRLHAAVACFLLALLACWVVSPYAEAGVHAVEDYCKVAVFYFLVVTTVRDERSLRRLVTLYVLAVGLYMAHSLLEFANGRYEYRQGIRRMIGVGKTYSDPNAFASTLLLALPMVKAFWADACTTAARLPLAGFLAAAGLCIVLTGSRTGFVGLLAFALLWVLTSPYRARALAAVGVVMLALVTLMPGYLAERFLTVVDSSHGPKVARDSAAGRLEGFIAGLEMWARHPLHGVGPGGFPLATGKGFHSHNVYGQVAGEMGTVGVVAFTFLLASFFSNWGAVRRLHRRHPEWSRDFPFRVVQATGLTVVLLLLTGWAGHNLYRFNWLWNAAFQLAALHCVRQREAEAAVIRPVLRSRPVLGRAAPGV